tara:strand:- start:653 stop:853 length:201 start_codon:yes stop_codon:yes gene_type:complete
MRLPVFPDDGLEINVCAGLSGKACVEKRSWFTTSFPNFIGFERPLDDIGNRAIFAPGKAMGQISRF